MAFVLVKKEEFLIEIINEQPHFIDGEHTVVDDIHKGHAAVKETRKAEIKESRNPLANN